MNEDQKYKKWIFGIILAATAAAAALLLGSRTRENSRAASCMNNLRMIDDCVLAAAMALDLNPEQRVPDDEVRHYLNPKTLVCPSGGLYTIPVIGDYPNCSYHGSAVHWPPGERELFLKTKLSNQASQTIGSEDSPQSGR